MAERKEDRRTVFTKAALKSSCKEMLREAPDKKVTVKALCERAGINRATFYLHYQTIDQLQQEMAQEVVDRVFAILVENNHSREGTQEITRQILLIFQSEAEICNLIFNQSVNIMDMKFHWDQASTQAWMDRYGVTRQEVEWIGMFTYGGTMALFRNWYANGFQDSVEDMARFLERISWQGLDGFEKS